MPADVKAWREADARVAKFLNRRKRYQDSREGLIHEHELRDDLEDTRTEIAMSQRLGVPAFWWIIGIAMGWWMGM